MSEILKKVNGGTFRNYSTIISNKELYKLFTSQEEMLYQCNSKLKRQNALKGKNTEPNQLLAYDIVILLSHYDKYISKLKFFFDRGCFRFKNQSCKSAIMKLLNYSCYI